MKKILLFLGTIGLSFSLLCGCQNNSPQEKTVEEQYKEKVDSLDPNMYMAQEYENIVPLTTQEAKDKLENGDTFILYHGRSDCRFCKYVYPELAKQSLETDEIYYVNLDYFILLKPEDETSELFTYNDNLYKEYLNYWGILGSPNLIYVKDGEILYNTSNLLNPDFFSDTATKEERQEYLDYMSNVINEVLTTYRQENNLSTNNVQIIK
jgi:predicted bacteriocin transport accessory protein